MSTDERCAVLVTANEKPIIVPAPSSTMPRYLEERYTGRFEGFFDTEADAERYIEKLQEKSDWGRP